MDVILNNSSGQPFYEQIVQQVKRLIQTGTRSGGSRTSGWTNIWRPPPPSPGRRASPGSSFWSGWGNGTRRKTKWNIHRIIY